ncbi:YtpI-like protein [Ureibacillus xyleni]|uniref:YtpI-like protein n=1 Tax=Ureibacillus xyleni TaxID=614648 RepID=A0A285S7V7_9BACL|nr:YtpI family protein [Ureibacillus xyleni]SOC03237.1 YtpI-like protein [Ureibacillus xyleni]
MLNIIFVVLIIVAFAAYFYFKTRQFRAVLPIRKKWYKAQAGVALGCFIIAFGINTCIIYPTLVGYLIGAVFVVVGLMYANAQYKRVRHEGRFVKEEFELNK